MNPTHSWQHTQNILCVRLDSMGDVLMTTPAIRALKTCYPRRRITLLTSPAGAAVAQLIPEVDAVITYDAPWLKATAARSTSQPELEMVERLRREQFDAAVIFTVFSQNPLPTAFLCYLAEIPLRLAHCHENPYQLLSDWIPDPEPGSGIRHEVQRQLDLVASVGFHTRDQRLSLDVRESDRQLIVQFLSSLGLDAQQPWLVIHPGATAPSRRYPPESFAAVGQQLAQMGYQILLTGTAPERELVEFVANRMGNKAYLLVDCFSLAQMAALISLSPLLITNNTGPAHLAAAVGTPVVDLYALTNPQHTPWQVPQRVLFHDVPCKNCFKSICPQGHQHCLSLVSPDAVVTAALELLQQSQPALSFSLPALETVFL